MSEEKKDGSSCKSGGGCCGCVKFFTGLVVGLLIALLAHCFMSGGCYKSKSMGMCPMMQKSVTETK